MKTWLIPAPLDQLVLWLVLWTGQSSGGGPPGSIPGAPPLGPPAVPPQVAFALSPVLISSAPLDFNQVGAIKLYYKASDALDITFDVEPGMTLKLFLESLCQHAVMFNWMTNFNIQINTCTYNLNNNHGTLTYDDVLQHDISYNGLNVHHAQNSIQIFNCLSGSLTEAGRSRVFLEARRYTVNGFTDGLLFLKFMRHLAHINTRATIIVIQTRLSMLDSKIVNIKDSVTKFNEFIKAQHVSLESRGETTLGMLVNLLKGYKAATDD
jgi:hypothetical protein